MINNFQSAIEAILTTGHSVLQIHPFNDTEVIFFVVHKFTPSMTTPTDDIQFNQVIGINITNVIKNNSAIDRNVFINQFQRFLNSENTSVVRMEFPNTIPWIKHAPANM